MGSMNELQRYPSNPDSTVTGYVDVKLCTNGTLQATSLMFGGASRLIALHIHKCKGGATAQTKTAELCHGPPVVNFCGDNSAGMIADGVKYTMPRAPPHPQWRSKWRTSRGIRSSTTSTRTARPVT